MGDPLAYPPLHSAEHLLTSLLEERLPALSGYESRLKSRKCVIEFDYPTVLTEADIVPVSAAMVAAIAADWPVTINEIHRAEAGHLPNLNEIPADLDPVRVVSIGAYPRACRGQHVTSTGDMRGFRITRFTLVGAGRYRLNFSVD